MQWYTILLIILTVLFIAVGIAILLVKQPASIIGCAVAPPIFARPDCVYVSEEYNDSTIDYPNNTSPALSLFSFTYNKNSIGGAYCEPTYYAYRYVRESDGGYGPLSNWFGPIQSGCNGDAANANQPVIGVAFESGPMNLSLHDGYYINIHRYYSTPDNNGIGESVPPAGEEGDIIGILPVPFTTIPSTGYSMIDGFYPVSQKGTKCVNSCSQEYNGIQMRREVGISEDDKVLGQY